MNTRSAHERGMCTAFASVADAWFWTVGALRARREGTGGSAYAINRPCDPDDVLRCLERLYRDRRIGLRHAHVLRVWGERQMAPDSRAASGRDAALWHEALGSLEQALRDKGIVA